MPHRDLKTASSDLLIIILDKDHSNQDIPQIGTHRQVVVTKFDDIEDPIDEWGSPITPTIADTILNAIVNTTGNAIVSCRGGVSRSAATALAISELQLAQIQGNNPCSGEFTPNRLVFDTIIKQAKTQGIQPIHTKEEIDTIFSKNRRLFFERLEKDEL